jgi:hypothetical protein
MGSDQHEERRRILVVANETVRGHRLLEEVRRRASDGAEVLVVAPAMTSRLRFLVSDIDGGLAEAGERVRDSVAALEAAGISARGEVGDCDPMLAIEDALGDFPADEIIISTHPPGRSNWLEKRIPGKIEQRFAVPITHVVVDLAHEREGYSLSEGRTS